MNNEFKVENLELGEHTLILHFNISSAFRKYFNADWLAFEFSERLDKVTTDLAIASFVVLLAPIIWTTGLIWEVDCLDYYLYQSLHKIKTIMSQSYIIDLPGKILCKKYNHQSKNSYNPALFFSGGVDATSSYIQLSNVNPELIVIKGFDFPHDNLSIWGNLSKKLVYFTQKGIKINVVSSPNLHNINFSNLNTDYKILNGSMSWWTGCEVGLFTLAHSIIPSYLRRYSSVYLSSSYDISKEPIFGAATPIIDAFKLSWCDFINWGSSNSRMDKLKIINNSDEKLYPLRVCWKTIDGQNCCNCEKCARTIVGLYIIGGDLVKYGFPIAPSWFFELRDKIQQYTFPAIYDWIEIVEIIKAEKRFQLDSNINWLCEVDFHSINAYNCGKKNAIIRKTHW